MIPAANKPLIRFPVDFETRVFVNRLASLDKS